MHSFALYNATEYGKDINEVRSVFMIVTENCVKEDAILMKPGALNFYRWIGELHFHRVLRMASLWCWSSQVGLPSA